MSLSVPLTSFFNDVKICVASYFMYGVSHEGKYCNKFLNQYNFIYAVNFINFINITLISHTFTKQRVCETVSII
jgi:hypothetical protein